MAKRKKSRKEVEETLVDITEVRDTARGFDEKNEKLIIGIVGGIALLIALFVGYRYIYQIPRNNEAMEQIQQAQYMFEIDSFPAALENPGAGYDGFLKIIDKYGSTKSGNLAKYYAGVSYLNLGDMDNAIKYMNSFSPKGSNLLNIMKYGVLGDAHAQKGDLVKAISFYEKAAKAGDDENLTPFYLKRAGLLNEREGNYKASLTAFEAIRENYPNSPDGEDIDKFIARVTSRMQ
jgi:tetratricopeptide (TPR) repeat protein